MGRLKTFLLSVAFLHSNNSKAPPLAAVILRRDTWPAPEEGPLLEGARWPQSVSSRISWLQERELLREEQGKWGWILRKGNLPAQTPGRQPGLPRCLAHPRGQRVLFGQARPAEGLSQGGGWGAHQDAQLRVPLQAPATGAPPLPNGGRGGMGVIVEKYQVPSCPLTGG